MAGSEPGHDEIKACPNYLRTTSYEDQGGAARENRAESRRPAGRRIELRRAADHFDDGHG
jgi:hypothetical protein